MMLEKKSTLRTNHMTIRTLFKKKRNQRGIALLMALIITFVVFMMIVTTIYMVTTSTKVSGAGKRYATACEASDGAVEIMKTAINLVEYGQPMNTLPFTTVSGNLLTALTSTAPAVVSVNLQGTTPLTNYSAQITVQMLYRSGLPGGRIEFGRSAGGSGGTAIYFKISTMVAGPNNTTCENTVVYRFVG